MAGLRRGGSVTRETVGGYRILWRERLGGGGFGTVYVGESEKDQRDRVAVKVMIPPPQCAAGYTRCYERELQALRASHHPNIVQLHHFEADASCVYILLELCDIDLLEFARHNDLTEALKYQFIYNILCAVLYLHGASIVHRDIKPNNVLIKVRQNHYVLKLSDLGLSMRIPEDGSSVISATPGVGTHGWQAPEVIRDPRQPNLKLHYGSKSDCFATGLNLHSICSHRRGQWMQPMAGKP
jgi:serine/threonine protein kinase